MVDLDPQPERVAQKPQLVLARRRLDLGATARDQRPLQIRRGVGGDQHIDVAHVAGTGRHTAIEEQGRAFDKDHGQAEV